MIFQVLSRKSNLPLLKHDIFLELDFPTKCFRDFGTHIEDIFHMSKHFCSKNNAFCFYDNIDTWMEISLVVPIRVSEFIEDASRVVVERQILSSNDSHQDLTSPINITLMRENKIKRDKCKPMSSRKVFDCFIEDDFIWE
jgi:hypothetical protein